MDRLELIWFDNEILSWAAELQPMSVRSLDAIHLAAALSLGHTLTALVTYDRRMIEAASALGLPVIAPGA